MNEHQQGTGTLESKYKLNHKFEVECEITYQFDLVPFPAAPKMTAKQSHIVDHVRRLDGGEIPDGDYRLFWSPDGSQEYQYLRQTQGEWAVLLHQSW